MKFLTLLYANPDAFATLAPEEIGAQMSFFADLEEETRSAGELIDAAGLTPVDGATTVRPSEGTPVTTDGPFAESKEVLISYAIYDVASRERIVELANRVTEVTGAAVEIRPVMDPGGMEM